MIQYKRNKITYIRTSSLPKYILFTLRYENASLNIYIFYFNEKYISFYTQHYFEGIIANDFEGINQLNYSKIMYLLIQSYFNCTGSDKSSIDTHEYVLIFESFFYYFKYLDFGFFFSFFLTRAIIAGIQNWFLYSLNVIFHIND